MVKEPMAGASVVEVMIVVQGNKAEIYYISTSCVYFWDFFEARHFSCEIQSKFQGFPQETGLVEEVGASWTLTLLKKKNQSMMQTRKQDEPEVTIQMFTV